MLESGFVMTVEGRQYTIINVLGRGANAIAYLAESRNKSIVTRCILKEYSPHSKDDFEEEKKRFVDSGRKQNEIKQFSVMSNQTPPVSHIFEANGTAYIDVTCYNGTTLDKFDDLNLLQYMEICRTIAKTVGYYHNSGYLCLDLKPENIFVLQNAPDDMVTQIVEFIDFDGIRDISKNNENSLCHYTREWAAPEQINHYAGGKISEAVDIYIMGEIVFYLLFGRHSTETEHRGFSKYPFEICKNAYRNYIERPEVQALFTKIFHGTIRSSAANRFKSIHEVTKLLDEIVTELQRKDYVIPILPSVSPDFVGRNTELRQITECLNTNPVLYITGIGGIGKSTLVKNFISRNKTDYDTIIYLEYDGDIQHTFCDDMQLQISTVSRQDHEPLGEYFVRKFDFFRRICYGKRVLFVLDNFSGKITKDLSSIINCGYDTIVVTRNQPPKNSFAYIEIGAIENTADIFYLIAQNLGRPLTNEERFCFEEIIALVQRHTLAIELITRQIETGKLSTQTALDLIRENGFSRFSENKIGNYKDGEEVYDTLSVIVSALFDATRPCLKNKSCTKG